MSPFEEDDIIFDKDTHLHFLNWLLLQSEIDLKISFG